MLALNPFPRYWRGDRLGWTAAFLVRHLVKAQFSSYIVCCGFCNAKHHPWLPGGLEFICFFHIPWQIIIAVTHILECFHHCRGSYIGRTEDLDQHGIESCNFGVGERYNQGSIEKIHCKRCLAFGKRLDLVIHVDTKFLIMLQVDEYSALRPISNHCCHRFGNHFHVLTWKCWVDLTGHYIKQSLYRPVSEQFWAWCCC